MVYNKYDHERGCYYLQPTFTSLVGNWNYLMWYRDHFQCPTQKRGSAHRISLDSPPCGWSLLSRPSYKGDRMIKGIFRVVGLVGTYEILKQLKEKERCSYIELPDTMSTASRNKRLIQLKSLKLITHHFERGTKRIEWYEITEKGIKFLSLLEQIDKLE